MSVRREARDQQGMRRSGTAEPPRGRRGFARPPLLAACQGRRSPRREGLGSAGSTPPPSGRRSRGRQQHERSTATARSAAGHAERLPTNARRRRRDARQRPHSPETGGVLDRWRHPIRRADSTRRVSPESTRHARLREKRSVGVRPTQVARGPETPAQASWSRSHHVASPIRARVGRRPGESRRPRQSREEWYVARTVRTIGPAIAPARVRSARTGAGLASLAACFSVIATSGQNWRRAASDSSRSTLRWCSPPASTCASIASSGCSTTTSTRSSTRPRISPTSPTWSKWMRASRSSCTPASSCWVRPSSWSRSPTTSPLGSKARARSAGSDCSRIRPQDSSIPASRGMSRSSSATSRPCRSSCGRA